MCEGTARSAWPKLERQVREFLQPLADAGLFGAHDAMPAFEVVCDERINGAEELAAGRVSVLVSLRSERLHGYQSFLLTQSRAGSHTRTVMSNVLPAGIRMSVRSGDARRAQDAGPGRRPTLAQALYGHYAEPRADPSAVLRVAEAPAPGRLDADAIARIHRDFRRGLQGF
jgi:hypothetical protein